MKLKLSVTPPLCSLLLQGALSRDKYGCSVGSAPAFDYVTTYFKECQPCPTGMYQVTNTVDGEDQNVCLYCVDLQYSDVKGATECKTCHAGSIPNHFVGDSCNECPAGTFSIMPTNGLAPLCADCPYGSTSEAGSAYCNNGNFFSWLTGYGYVPLSADQNTEVQKNLKETLADTNKLSTHTGIFLYSAVTGIFGNQIEALENFDAAPTGSEEAWQAWQSIDWQSNQYLKENASALKATLQATGELVMNVLSSSSDVGELDQNQVSKVSEFVKNVNPSATISYSPGYLGDFIRYKTEDNSASIENEIVNIQNGLAYSDFRQVGEAYGILVREVMGI